MNYFRRFRDWAISAALLATPFFFLSANLKDPADVGVFDRTLLQISAPVQGVASRAADSISSLLEEYFYLVDVKAENERLTEELGQTRRQAQELRDNAAENERLRELLALRERLPGEMLTARVIVKDTVSPYFRVDRIVLDRGAEERVEPGMPVVSAHGLVGQIRRTWGRYADVLLTVDSTSAVDVVSPRNGARGSLRGTGEDNRYLCRLQYLQRSDEMQLGDEIYTSGFGRRFPGSILVGRVTNVEVRSDSGLYQMVEVAPAVNFSDLEEVLILTSGHGEDADGEAGDDEGS